MYVRTLGAARTTRCWPPFSRSCFTGAVIVEFSPVWVCGCVGVSGCVDVCAWVGVDVGMTGWGGGEQGPVLSDDDPMRLALQVCIFWGRLDQRAGEEETNKKKKEKQMRRTWMVTGRAESVRSRSALMSKVRRYGSFARSSIISLLGGR
jgi:hypothetical protein